MFYYYLGFFQWEKMSIQSVSVYFRGVHFFHSNPNLQCLKTLWFELRYVFTVCFILNLLTLKILRYFFF